MKWLLAASAVSLVAFDASAASRYDITNMTCPKVQSLVDAEGEVILTYASRTNFLGMLRYDRYVASQRFCATGEVVRRTGVPTTDAKYCQVRKCVQSDIFVSD